MHARTRQDTPKSGGREWQVGWLFKIYKEELILYARKHRAEIFQDAKTRLISKAAAPLLHLKRSVSQSEYALTLIASILNTSFGFSGKTDI